MTVLSRLANSSHAGRAWSYHDHVVSKKRNRMDRERADMSLVKRRFNYKLTTTMRLNDALADRVHTEWEEWHPLYILEWDVVNAEGGDQAVHERDDALAGWPAHDDLPADVVDDLLSDEFVG
eukprot:jgi/Tetstr1/440670/TSEL_028979.t1